MTFDNRRWQPLAASCSPRAHARIGPENSGQPCAAGALRNFRKAGRWGGVSAPHSKVAVVRRWGHQKQANPGLPPLRTKRCSHQRGPPKSTGSVFSRSAARTAPCGTHPPIVRADVAFAPPVLDLNLSPRGHTRHDEQRRTRQTGEVATVHHMAPNMDITLP